ncbi:MAG: SCP2 sterol-binding domain-containing protein [Actinomycetota bacterium]|nr:SCP2 sterol-binding domain-containing protein [Actinomycetota bacterium]
MAEWLSPAWVEDSTAAVEVWPFAGDGPPAPVALTVTVTRGAGGDGELAGGRPAATTYLRHWWAADGVEERELAVTVSEAEAGAMLAGELSPSVAFMRGRLKTSGDPGAVLDVLAASATPSFVDVLARLRAAAS